MANLTDYFVKGFRAVKLRRGKGRTVSVYEVEFLTTSDTLTIPSAAATTAVASLTANVTATAAAANEGETIITFSGSGVANGNFAIVAISHLAGLNNNLGRDEDPT